MSAFQICGSVFIVAMLLVCIALLILIAPEDDAPPIRFERDEEWLE